MSPAAPVLVLRALGVGDLATAVPALRGLRRAHPRQAVWLAAPRWLAPLVALTDAVDRLIPLDGVAALPAHLPPGPWPPSALLRVNLHGRGPQSHRLLAGLPGGRLLGFACPDAGHTDGPPWRGDEHEVDRWCRLLAWYGIAADRDDLTLRRPAGRPPADGAVVVHPGAKAPQRRWSPQRYAAVARAFAAGGRQVVVTGSDGERRLAARVAAGAGLPPSAVLAGDTGLAELAALVAAARLVVCGDTGPAHLATAYGTPSVVLCGPTPPRRWGPPADRPAHRALWHGPDGLPQITPAQVVAAAAEVTRGDVAAGPPAAAW